MSKFSRIIATGSFLPPHQVSNAQLVSDLAEQGIDVQRRFVLDSLGRMDAQDLAKFESLIIQMRDLMRERQSKTD